jgi:hypothetical protein
VRGDPAHRFSRYPDPFIKKEGIMKKLFLFFSFLIVASCDDQTDDAASGNVIMPLKVGNYWTFVDSSFDDTGVFIEADTSTLSITGKKTIAYQGQSYEVYLWTWTSYGADHSWLVWNGEDGLYLFGGTSPKGDYVLTKSLSIKYPAETGDEWEEYNVMYSSLDSSFSISDTTVTACSSLDAALASPLGNLSCYTYEYSEDFGAAKNIISGLCGTPAELLKGNAITTVTLFYIPDIGYVGLTDETGGVITYKKTIIGYLAEK